MVKRIDHFEAMRHEETPAAVAPLEAPPITPELIAYLEGLGYHHDEPIAASDPSEAIRCVTRSAKAFGALQVLDHLRYLERAQRGDAS